MWRQVWPVSHEHSRWVLDNLRRTRRLSRRQFDVLLRYADHASIVNGLAWPGTPTIARDTGIAQGDVLSARDALIEHGFLIDAGKQGSARCFFVNFPEVELQPRHSTATSTARSTATSKAGSTAGSTATHAPDAGTSGDNQNQNMNRNPNRPAMGSSILSELVAECVDHDLFHRPPTEPAGDALRKKIADDYKPIVAEALQRRAELDLPPPDTDDLRLILQEWSFARRHNEPMPSGVERRLFPKPAKPPCARCGDFGHIDHPTDRQAMIPCPNCQPHRPTGEPT